MSGAIWAVGELDAGGRLTKLSSEVATAARLLAQVAGGGAVGVVVGRDPAPAAAEMAAYLPRVIAVAVPDAADHPLPALLAARVAALVAAEAPSLLLLGATPDGRDAAGMLAVLCDLPVAWNADGIALEDGAVSVETTAIGGRVVVRKGFTGARGIVLLRPGAADAAPAAAPGTMEMATPVVDELPAVRIIETLPAQATEASIEEARVVVVGGRGVGGPEGFAVLREIAAEVGGAVGATRAAVDSGWIPFNVQVGQTGRTVRPVAYLGFGVSGAIQHTVGMRAAGTIVVVNRDPDAPFTELADLYVVGDLATVAPALRDALRERRRTQAGG